MKKRLLVRMDDFGGCGSANSAILACLDAGVARSIGVMGPGLAVAEGCRSLALRRDACVGVHGVLNAEWDAVKWGPVAGAAAVPSLVEAGGVFTRTPNVLYERGFVVDEAIAELQAQIRLVRSFGLRPVYLDEHMGFGWLPGLGDAVAELARAEGLVFRPPLAGLPRLADEPADPVDAFLARVDTAPTGDYLAVYHPGRDADDMREYRHEGIAPGQVARERAADTALLTAARLREGLSERGVALLDYADFA